ncbi:helix-turn-helix domain-containing protein [Prevotella sp. OH937_COT-195]|uniref:helix-turn-helix domain-containing protein n=1 Tax=Prevotella sp. OH937_COT-195 TaxID=2491051 RepID=UPI000F64879C|nr:helix-turn-helix domain-containing protein [Prevotella sp. OH937_COT-195]RRC99058.1 hypothetical protein EII32_08475 [Prevotella sp. OH937_COT-195]
MITTRPNVEYKGLYSQAQAARALGVDRHTIARYVKQGYINVRVRRTDRKTVIPGGEILKAWGGMVF